MQFILILNSTSMETTINERIKRLYERSGERSIRSYALKIGVAPTTLNECIKGAEPRFSLLKAILDGEPYISSEWFLRGTGNMVIEENSIDSIEIEELKTEIFRLETENKVLREMLGLKAAKESKEKSA